MAANVRKPTAPPRPDDVADRDRWEAITTGSLAATQATAEKLRIGLAAFVALVTGGVFLKGPDVADDIATSWLALLTVLAAAGLTLSIVGLWLALRAAAGAPGEIRYQAIAVDYGGIRQFEIVAARRASDALRASKIVIAVSLLGLGGRSVHVVVGPHEAPLPRRRMCRSTPARSGSAAPSSARTSRPCGLP